MNLTELKLKTPAELLTWAEELGIEGVARARKNDVIFALLKALAAMQVAPGCRLTRMSGSGATVFGLFDDAAAAKGAALALQRPGWWVRSCGLAGR